MNHELRTPLNGILGCAQILKRDKKIMQIKKLETNLTIIERCGSQLLNLINDILDLSKIEAQKMELYLHSFHLQEMLARLIDIIEVQAKKKTLFMKLLVPPDLPICVSGDEKRLNQILLNLLSNAVKFTDRGEVILQVEILNRNEQHCHCRFAVIDHGVGIAETDLTSIFQTFNQVGEQNRKSEGTGLGLSISRQLVQLMGSDLHVKSHMGQGSTFWFDLLLPIAECSELEQATSFNYVIGYQGKCQKILVVDDVSENRLVLMSILGSLGFEMIEACDGREALLKIPGFKPDLILCDLIMPVMSGFELMHTLRDDKNLCHLKVVAVSASSFLATERIHNEYYFDATLDKPVQVEKLFQVIQNQLEITWIYEKEIPDIAEDKEFFPDSMSIPDLSELYALNQLTREGDFIELNKRLDQLTAYPLFVKKIRVFANSYQDKEICHYLDFVSRIKQERPDIQR